MKRQLILVLAAMGLFAACTAATVQQPPSSADGLREAHITVPTGSPENSTPLQYWAWENDATASSIDRSRYPAGTTFTVYGGYFSASATSGGRVCIALVDSSGAAFGEQCTDAAVTQDFMDFRPVDFDFPWSIDLPAGQREYQLQVRWADCPGDCYAGAPMSVDLVARW